MHNQNTTDKIKGIVGDFKKLATKIKEDNGQVKKKLKERELVLDACQKEYQKLYYEHNALKKIVASLQQQQQQ